MDLAPHYSRFRVSERLLLTGHSHQAWPDVAFEAQQQAWLDAAELVDDKWPRAMQKASRVGAGFRRLLGDPDGDLALGANTHELIVRLLSALLPMFGPVRTQDPSGPSVRTSSDLAGPHRTSPGPGPRRTSPHLAGPRRTSLITTDGEFHTIRRQLDRLAEAGLDVMKVPARPAATLAGRLARLVDDGTAVVLVSSVLFETAEIVPGLDALDAACARHGAALLVDAYHHLNVVPFDLAALGLSEAFVVGGGYKYCQLGEGNCFLRVPPGRDLRPLITGWFSEFAELAEAKTAGEVRYGIGGARFAGATYDPTSHYRAARVFDFFEAMALTPDRLREISRRQVGLLEARFRALDVDPAIASLPAIDPDGRAGFLAIQAPGAASIVATLRERGVWADARGPWLRFGPAPYLTDTQLTDAIGMLGEVVKA